MPISEALAIRTAKFAGEMDFKFGDDRGLKGRLTQGMDDRLSRYAVTYPNTTLNALVAVIGSRLGSPSDRDLLVDVDEGIPIAELYVWESGACDVRLTVVGAAKSSALFPTVRRGIVLERLSDARRASPEAIQRAAELLR